MKIAFLAPSLEPGRSGVGDYTRLLAEELERAGHECVLLGLNDTHGDKQQGSFGTRVLRFSATDSWRERFTETHQALARFNPAWVSLQFVPYGYHPKGIAWALDRGLPPVLARFSTHVFFHEIWIGCSQHAGWRQRVIGLVQRHLILRLVSSLRPGMVHTSNSLYASILGRDGIASRQLPLFGAIPIVPTHDARNTLTVGLRNAGAEIDVSERNQWLIGGFFGTIHGDWPSDPFFNRMVEISAETGCKVLLISIGRSSPGIWDRLVKEHGGKIRMAALGEQSVELVSHLLQSLDFGISTTPTNIIGKSMSTAAMIEHGLPVIASWPGAPVRGIEAMAPQDPQIISDLTRVTPYALKSLRRPPRARLPEVAAAFCAALANAVQTPKRIQCLTD